MFEPWCRRTADVGCCGLIAGAAPGDVALAAPHRLIVDARGGFRGVVIADEGAGRADLDAGEHARLTDAATAAGHALGAVGYRGPFGIDAFRWRDGTGAERFHPLCEINARLTFGWVARAWAERLGEPVALFVGPGPGPGRPRGRMLLGAAEDDRTTAWLEPPTSQR